MKSTGIIRRIDDLGRIVIPKEIRRVLGVSEGDPMEMYTEAGAVVLKKYNPGAGYASRLKELKEDIAGDADLMPEVAKQLIEGLDEAIGRLGMVE